MKFYKNTLITTGLLTLIFHSQGVTVILVVSTLGLALPIMAAIVNIFLLLLCAIPAVCFRTHTFKFFGIALSVLATVFVFVAPYMYAQEKVKQAKSILLSNDYTIRNNSFNVQNIKSIEIKHIKTTTQRGLRSAITENKARCGPICKRIIIRDEIDWVKVTSIIESNQGEIVSIKSSQIKSNSNNNCSSITNDCNADMTIVNQVNSSEYPWGLEFEHSMFLYPELLRNLSVIYNAPTEKLTIMKNTELKYSIVGLPVFYTPLNIELGYNKKGYTTIKNSRGFNSRLLYDFDILHELGF